MHLLGMHLPDRQMRRTDEPVTRAPWLLESSEHCTIAWLHVCQGQHDCLKCHQKYERLRSRETWPCEALCATHAKTDRVICMLTAGM